MCYILVEKKDKDCESWVTQNPSEKNKTEGRTFCEDFLHQHCTQIQTYPLQLQCVVPHFSTYYSVQLIHSQNFLIILSFTSIPSLPVPLKRSRQYLWDTLLSIKAFSFRSVVDNGTMHLLCEEADNGIMWSENWESIINGLESEPCVTTAFTSLACIHTPCCSLFKTSHTETLSHTTHIYLCIWVTCCTDNTSALCAISSKSKKPNATSLLALIYEENTPHRLTFMTTSSFLCLVFFM